MCDSRVINTGRTNLLDRVRKGGRDIGHDIYHHRGRRIPSSGTTYPIIADDIYQRENINDTQYDRGSWHEWEFAQAKGFTCYGKQTQDIADTDGENTSLFEID